MFTPKTFVGGIGRLFIGLMILNVPVSMFKSLTGDSSEEAAKKPEVEQVQSSPSPVATPSPSPSPVAATTYDVTLQVNTLDGDRIPQPGELEIAGDIYKASVPFEGLNNSDETVRQVMVYEFNFVAKTFRQYCEDCLMPLSRNDADEEPLVVDSVTPEGFSITPKGMADEVGTKDFYVLRLTGSVKPDVWLESTEQAQTIEEPIAPQIQEFREPDPEPVAEPVPATPQVRTTAIAAALRPVLKPRHLWKQGIQSLTGTRTV